MNQEAKDKLIDHIINNPESRWLLSTFKKRYYGKITQLISLRTLYAFRGYLTEGEEQRLLQLDKFNWRRHWYRDEHN